MIHQIYNKNYNIVCSLFIVIVCSFFLFLSQTAHAGFSAIEYYATYPELYWLATEHVQVTQENGAQASVAPYSVQVAGAFYPELDRTLLALKCLEWFWNGKRVDYEALIQEQLEPRLTWESFSYIHDQLMRLSEDLPGFSRDQIYEALKVKTVIGDLGKSIIFKQKMERLGIQAKDHDVFLRELLHHPEALKELPSFQKLPKTSQQLIQDISEIGHFGHMSHLEGGPRVFTETKQFLKKKNGLALLGFAYAAYVMDVAGAAGHVTQKSSIAFNEDVYRVHAALGKSLQKLQDHTEEEVYEDYLRQRAEWIDIKEVATPMDFLVTRLSCLMRLYTPVQAVAIRTALKDLSEEEFNAVQCYFYIDLLNYKNSILAREATPTYMPAVFINLANNSTLGITQLERIQQAVMLGTPFLAKVLLGWRKFPYYDPDLVICFNGIAKIARESPKKLANSDFVIDIHTGYVMLKL